MKRIDGSCADDDGPPFGSGELLEAGCSTATLDDAATSGVVIVVVGPSSLANSNALELRNGPGSGVALRGPCDELPALFLPIVVSLLVSIVGVSWASLLDLSPPAAACARLATRDDPPRPPAAGSQLPADPDVLLCSPFVLSVADRCGRRGSSSVDA